MSIFKRILEKVLPKKIEIFKYLFSNWKLIYHIIIRTNKFGVNNRRWEKHKSIFGIPVWKQIASIFLIYPIIKSYKRAKWRAIYLGFLHPNTVKLLWSEHSWFK